MADRRQRSQPVYRSQGNQQFRSEQRNSALKRGQNVPYNVNGAPTGGTVSWGGILGTLASQTDLVAALAAKQDKVPAIQTPATNAASITPTFADDQVNLTGHTVAIVLNNPTGTAVHGKEIVLRIKDNGTARAITYGTQYRAFGVALPTTTTINKTLYLRMRYNATDTKWDVISVTQEL